MSGKSTRDSLVIINQNKPCMMKCPIGKRLRAARPKLMGRQIDCIGNNTTR